MLAELSRPSKSDSSVPNPGATRTRVAPSKPPRSITATNLAMCIANLRIRARPVDLKSLRVLSAGQITINASLLITSVISFFRKSDGDWAMNCIRTALSTAVLFCNLLLNAGLMGRIRHGNDGKTGFSLRVMLLFDGIHFSVGFSQQSLGINAILRVKGCAQAQ